MPRVLHLAFRDTSGVPGRWAAAHRRAGWDARLLVELPHPYGYDTDAETVRWTPGSQSAAERADRIASWLEWADVVIAYDHPFYLDTAIESGKPVLFRALGSSARDHADEIMLLLASENVARASAGTADLASLLDVELAGAPYELLEPAILWGWLRLCHCPSDRNLKGTDAVLRAADEAGWQVDLIEDATNTEVLARKRSASLVVDGAPGCVPDGYGVNSVEAMALGLPAISGASQSVRERWMEAGSPVVLVDDEAQFLAELIRLRDREARLILGAAGRRFVSSFHSPERRAAEDLAAVERVGKVAA